MHAKYLSRIRTTGLTLLCLTATLFTPVLADTSYSGLTDLGTLGGDSTFPLLNGGGINQRGQILGQSNTGAFDNNFGWVHHAFLYSHGILNDILPLAGDALSTPVALNDCGQVLAFSEGTANGELAFLYDSGHYYRIEPLQPGNLTNGSSLNSQGQVIGTTPVFASDGHFVGDRGFLWDRFHGTRGIATLTPDPAHPDQFLGSSQANALNNFGLVAGLADTPYFDAYGFPIRHAIVYDGCTHDLGTLSPDPAHQGHFLGQSMATGINDLGQIIGTSDTSQTDDFGTPLSHGFVWDALHGMRDLGTLYPDPQHQGKFLGGSTPFAINAVGQIIGVADTPTPNPNGFGNLQHAFLWTPGGQDGIRENRQMKDLGVLPGGTTSTPTGLNDLGQVIGVSDSKYSFQRAFFYSNGEMQDITHKLAGGLTSTPVQMNACGQVAGYFDTELGEIHPFVFDGDKFTDLGTLGGGVSFANGINNAGVVTGNSYTYGFAQIRAWVSSPQ